METNNTTQTLNNLYQSLQRKPWGKSSIVEGFYHISLIENADCREKAIAYTRWKQYHDDIFDSEIIISIPLGALFNKHSSGPSTSIENLLGKVLYIEHLSKTLNGDKPIYSIIWHFADRVFLPPSDLLLDWQMEEELDRHYADCDEIFDSEEMELQLLNQENN
jgi:hypothetical protein